MNRLKEFREDALMTVRELSERSGVSEDTITKIENGHRKGRGTTLRKLAKALGVAPHQLSPQQFDRGAESEISSRESIVKPETASTRSSEAVVSKIVEFGDRLEYALNVVQEVRQQTGLSAQDFLKHRHLTEGQRNILLVIARNEALPPSEVARQVGGDIGTVDHALAVLREHGLVWREESGRSRATSLGKSAADDLRLADDLSKGGLHYDKALEHVSTLMKAYESTLIFDDRPRRVEASDANLSFYLQEYVVRTIRDIVDVAEPAPDALTVAQRLPKQTSPVIGADLARALARKLGLEFVELTERDIDRDLVGLIPEGVLRKHRAIPLRISRTRHLVVAMSDPSNLYALEDLRIISGYQITPVVATEDEIRNLQAKIFATGGRITKTLEERPGPQFREDTEFDLGIEASPDERPIIRLVRSVLLHAVSEGASDIHIEPQDKEVVVRFRVDGVLREVMSIPPKLQHAITARIKLLAELDIAERTLPQEGRFSVKFKDEKVDFEVTSLPTAYGEKIVLRLLNTKSGETDLDQETTERANYLDSLRE